MHKTRKSYSAAASSAAPSSADFEFDELFDVHEPDAYITFEDYQNINEKTAEASAKLPSAAIANGHHRNVRKNKADENNDDNNNSNATTDDEVHPDSMAAIRLSVLIADNKDATTHSVGHGVPTAGDLLNVHPVDEEREITRLMRRTGIEAEQSRATTLSMKLTRKSAFGPPTTRLPVPGLKDMYIDDSYFFAAAEKIFSSDDNGRSSHPERIESTTTVESVQFVTPRERYKTKKRNGK